MVNILLIGYCYLQDGFLYAMNELEKYDNKIFFFPYFTYILDENHKKDELLVDYIKTNNINICLWWNNRFKYESVKYIIDNIHEKKNTNEENNINNDNKILVSKFIYININDNTINNYFDNKSIINNIDENRIIKNNIIIFLTLLYIINLDRSQILNLKFEKINNYTTYSINGNIYFDKVKIYISK